MTLASRFAIAALALSAANAHADVSVTIVGNVATAEIALPSAAVPTYTATLRLEFTSPENLSVENLGIEAFVISPAAIQTRLPSLQVTVPNDFPVLIRVEPPFGNSLLASSFELDEPGSLELGFRNSVAVEVRTTNLPFVQDGPARLLRAPLGKPFVDITSEVIAGSIRTRARTGGFSEFVIANDLRNDEVRAADEYVRADLRLDDPAIAPALAATLEAALALSRTEFDNDNFDIALLRLQDFDALVAASASGPLPNRYRARRDLNNVRGEIETLSANIAFFLRRLDD